MDFLSPKYFARTRAMDLNDPAHIARTSAKDFLGRKHASLTSEIDLDVLVGLGRVIPIGLANQTCIGRAKLLGLDDQKCQNAAKPLRKQGPKHIGHFGGSRAIETKRFGRTDPLDPHGLKASVEEFRQRSEEQICMERPSMNDRVDSWVTEPFRRVVQILSRTKAGDQGRGERNGTSIFVGALWDRESIHQKWGLSSNGGFGQVLAGKTAQTPFS